MIQDTEATQGVFHNADNFDEDNYSIIIMEPDGKIRDYNMAAAKSRRITFGRNADNDIQVNSSIVSGQHGFFCYVNGRLVITDSGSTNGTYLNGRYFKRSSFRLKEGDIIRIDASNTRSSMGVIMYCTTSRLSGNWSLCDVPEGKEVVVGRQQDCTLCINNISVSRHHARISCRNGAMQIEDLNSSNGVFVNGERISGRSVLNGRDVISIGTSLLLVDYGRVYYKSKIGGTRVSMKNVSRSVKVKGKNIKILNDVSINIEPNEFVAIIGGSGAGKSTVMNAMSGFEKADSGIVMVNNVDLYRNYNVLKNMMGYVPQQDIIYENMTLYKMLEYSAKLRMPSDVTAEERCQRINEALNMVELTEHRDKFIRSLSGGQKKRASIAVEMLADPSLFFLDEPTSGLDPGTEEGLMKTLRRLAKNKGKTIVMVTHTTQNLHLCDKILFMGKGGKVCFFGTPNECLRFFNVKNLTEIYNKALTDEEVDNWNRKWNVQHENDRIISREDNRIHKEKKPSFLRQFAILASRYMTLIKNDKQRLLMIFIQPILVTILLAIVAADDVFNIYDSTKPILFAASCAGIWVGLFNSIQEICKERNILKREYMANLRLGAYVLSKFAVQFLIAFIQAMIITFMFKAFVGGPDKGVSAQPSIEIMVTMVLTIFSSAAIGLVVSALSKNSDKAMTMAPFILIIQLLFSGILFELKGASKVIANFTVSSWSVQALGTISNLNDMEHKIAAMKKFEEVYEFASAHLNKCWNVMFLFVAVCFVISILVLRNVASDSR